MMTLLADLGGFKQSICDPDSGSNRIILEVDPVYDQIFSEIAETNLRPAGTEILDFLKSEDTYLTVPGSGMGIILKPVIFDQSDPVGLALGDPSAGTEADCPQRSPAALIVLHPNLRILYFSLCSRRRSSGSFPDVEVSLPVR